jgi:hypothetical protein
MSKQAVHGHTTRGGYTLKRAAMELGKRMIDRRTTLGKVLDHWRGGLIADLGSIEQVST